MSNVTLSMKMSPKAAGALFSKACRLEDENSRLQARVAELVTALQDAADIIQADANTEENYGSLCRMGSALAKDSSTAWLLRQKADAVDSFVKWVNPHWPKSIAAGIADDSKNYTYELRQAADEADKAGGGNE